VHLSPNDGFYLVYLDQLGLEVTDTLHDSLNSAFGQAEFEFGLTEVEWTVHIASGQVADAERRRAAGPSRPPAASGGPDRLGAALRVACPECGSDVYVSTCSECHERFVVVAERLTDAPVVEVVAYLLASARTHPCEAVPPDLICDDDFLRLHGVSAAFDRVNVHFLQRRCPSCWGLALGDVLELD
jgi:hypothetical protein